MTLDRNYSKKNRALTQLVIPIIGIIYVKSGRGGIFLSQALTISIDS